MNNNNKSLSPKTLRTKLLQILGALYLIDGISLLIRGCVGGLFLLHETSSTDFKIIFILHVYIGGVVYGYFGYGLLANKTWTANVPGYFLALSSIIWIIPKLGADFFTAILGVSYILIMIILKRKHLAF